jgi:hypothetical protein
MSYIMLPARRRRARGLGGLGGAADEVNDIVVSYVRKIEAASTLAEVERQWSGFSSYERLWRANPKITPDVRNDAANTVQAARAERRAQLGRKAQAEKKSEPGFFENIAEALGVAAPVAQRVMEDRQRRKDERRAKRADRAAGPEAAPSGGGGGLMAPVLLIGGLGLALFVASRAGLFKK